jgi:hypothetical protein
MVKQKPVCAVGYGQLLVDIVDEEAKLTFTSAGASAMFTPPGPSSSSIH